MLTLYYSDHKTLYIEQSEIEAFNVYYRHLFYC